jgi:hypothetical protein
MREHGPAEYGEGTTLTDTARAIGEAHGVRTCRALGDLTDAAQVERVVAARATLPGGADLGRHPDGGPQPDRVVARSQREIVGSAGGDVHAVDGDDLDRMRTVGARAELARDDAVRLARGHRRQGPGTRCRTPGEGQR